MSKNLTSASITHNNPNGLLDCVKPIRVITSTIDPTDSDGESQWLWINTTTSNLFNKIGNGGETWVFIYSFNTGSPVPGITNIVNDSPSTFGLFNGIVGTTAHFKSLNQNPNNKIVLTSSSNNVSIGLGALNSSDVQLPLVQNILNNYSAVSDPTVNDDSTQNYSIGSFWWNVSTNPANLFFAQSVAVSSAVWVNINVSATGFLTNCSNLGLIGPFAGLSGSIANFRSFVSTDNSVSIVQAGNNINFGVPGIFKDLSSYGFSTTATTPILSSNTFAPLQAPWIISPSGYVRPLSVGWGITGTSPFFNITRLTPSSSLNGRNYYLVNYSFIVTASGVVGSPELTIRWNSTGNVTIGNSHSVVVIPTTGIKDTLNGSFLVSSNDIAAFSLFVEIQSTISLIAVTVEYATCTITQI